MAKFTRKAIMDTFLELLKYNSLDKITIKDIIENTEVNRNTFYYYFDDIFDLIDQIFKEELQRILSETATDSSFYEEYERTAEIILNHKAAIVHIYNSRSREILHKYIWEATNAFVERFVRKEAENYPISEDGIAFIIYFYSSAISGNTMRWIEDGMKTYRDDFLKIMSTSFESTIKDMILNYLKFEHS